MDVIEEASGSSETEFFILFLQALNNTLVMSLAVESVGLAA